jgi:hypothetical protein
VLNVVEATPFNTQSYLTTPAQVWPGSTVTSKLTLRNLTPPEVILVGASNRFGAFRLTVEFPPFCEAVTVPKSKVIGSAFTTGTRIKKVRKQRLEHRITPWDSKRDLGTEI